jgi:signal transduction histidine kinase
VPGHDDAETALANSGVLTVPIVLDGRMVGLVGVPRRAPFAFLLQQFAPMLSSIATLVLVVGALFTSALIFGPPRRRLQSLEMASRRVGAGDFSARALEYGGDEITAVAASFNAMARDLEARADALALADRTRRQLLADVSHELNTPITAMRGYLETLRMPDIPLDADTRDRYLSIVSDETARVERLIGDLLELARLESGGLKLTVEDLPVADLFARVAARHEQSLQLKTVTMAQTIGPGAEIVRGDRVRLEQAVQNLAANALRYAPQGSILRLASRIDDGAGIAPAHIPHIFERFYKVDPSRHDASGTGLGLSIVKAVAEQHGGRIAVRSRPGRTIFEITGLQVGAPGTAHLAPST